MILVGNKMDLYEQNLSDPVTFEESVEFAKELNIFSVIFISVKLAKNTKEGKSEINFYSRYLSISL